MRGVKMSRDTVAGIDGDGLLDDVRAAAVEPVDAEWLEQLCDELDGRITRGDMMIGILPIEASEVLVRGRAALAVAGRPEGWVRLGRCLLDQFEVDVEIAWPSEHPFPDEADEPVGAALRCFAEAAGRREFDGALLFASTSRQASDEAKRHALRLLEPWLADDPEGRATYWHGLVHYALGESQVAAGAHHRAAAAGNADAMFELHVLYATGDGVEQDADRAHDFLVRAAELEQPRALYNVAAGYATGSGFPQDEATAAAYYERAGNAGNAKASATLGVMYLVGQGVTADPAAAGRWFDLAEEDGFDVDDWLDRLGLQRP